MRRPVLPWLGRRRRELELDEEIASHLAMAERDRVADGEAPDSARASARRELGNDALVKEVTLEVVDLISKDKEIKSGSRAKLISVIEEKVLPHFNFTAMTALAMGQNWGKATPEQKKQLTEAFKTLLVRTYASALASYSDQRFDFRPLRAKPTDTDVTVNVRVVQSGAEPVKIDYEMEKTPRGWKFKQRAHTRDKNRKAVFLEGTYPLGDARAPKK